MGWIPYDEDLAAAGLIVAEFVEEVIGWANESEMRAGGMEPVMVMGSNVAVGWVAGQGRPVEPVPLSRFTLRWRTP